jgi:acyl-coenzyme A thioesterase PaaI-like protein
VAQRRVAAAAKEASNDLQLTMNVQKRMLSTASMSIAHSEHTAATPAEPAERDPVADGIRTPPQPGWFDKVEAFVSRLSMRDNFWNSVCSLLWLPLAFMSGIRMKELQPGSFAAQAILPFRRFNRNWYRAMAGGALLANSEIAGGSYVFGICGADYTVVCKNLNYTFLRPCFGPAVYRMTAREDISTLAKAGGEFNVTIDMDISQQAIPKKGKVDRDRRVGKCEATFHVTPKVHHKSKALRRKK